MKDGRNYVRMPSRLIVSMLSALAIGCEMPIAIPRGLEDTPPKVKAIFVEMTHQASHVGGGRVPSPEFKAYISPMGSEDRMSRGSNWHSEPRDFAFEIQWNPRTISTTRCAVVVERYWVRGSRQAVAVTEYNWDGEHWIAQ
jgi:hypothetical protein